MNTYRLYSASWEMRQTNKKGSETEYNGEWVKFEDVKDLITEYYTLRNGMADLIKYTYKLPPKPIE